MFDFDEPWDLFHNDDDDVEKEIFDFGIVDYSTSNSRESERSRRAIDFPSMKKHYGVITFFDRQFPIIYRLLKDTLYIPYIRLSYVLQIFEEPSLKKYLLNIRNLPVIEMTKIECVYYDQLSSLDHQSDWSHSQLLNISMLDAILNIIKVAQSFHFHEESSSMKWEETISRIREETKERWILEEKIVLTRLAEQKSIDSSCISSNSLAQRRSFFEQRVILLPLSSLKSSSVIQLDHSIVDNAGGFVQIGCYIYPFIKNPCDNQLYINLNDIRQTFVRPLSDFITFSKPSSPLSCLYQIVLQQARAHLHHTHNNHFAKIFPSTNEESLRDDLPFLPLQRLLHLFLTKDSQLNLQFVQLFETSSWEHIELNYQSLIDQQFIMTHKYQGALINNRTPSFLHSTNNRQIISIPTQRKTSRIINNHQRIYLNLILLYHGLWKHILTYKKQWFFTEVKDKENIQLEILQGK